MELKAFLLSLVAGLSTNLGLIFTFLKVKPNKIITLSLSFAFIVMLLISIKELIAVSIPYLYQHYNIILFLFIILIVPIICYLFIKICSTYIKGENNLEKIGILNCLSLMLHNFPEGIIVFASSVINISLGFKVFLSIAIHNLPEGICVALPIYYSTNSRKKAFFYTFISGIAEPFGAGLTWILLRPILSDTFIYLSLYFVGSLMIILSLKEILPEILKYQEKLMMIVGFLLGLFILLI